MSSAASNLNENAAVDALAVRFADSISCEPNKPDYRELDLDSPVSHLMISNAGGGVPTSSSSGSSSGSATGKASLQGRSGAALRSQLSGDISDMSEIQSPSRPGHRRSVSAGAPWIYSSSKHPDKSNLASKVNPSIYLSGNICPSGKIPKPTTLQSPSGSRPRTLGSGTGNYGHGSVIRRAAEKANGPFMEESMMYKQGWDRLKMHGCTPTVSGNM
ncbi:hypothetical protein SAY86_027397 [Trapa natans]|uniref:Uncharacterized protein n=1 Tax=Trapa natans TaxID=22666 RepID=A0AAN7QIT8_TRANT|nr:hypothetical protein SAY86_027397 [Trapa natans]